jgi:hypothetical protein
MVALAATATQVRFSFIDERGSNATRSITIVPDPNANPVVLGTNLLFIKALTTNINGSAVIPLLPITYTVTFQGSLNKATLYVYDTNAVLDMVTLTTNLYQITNIQPQYVTLVDSRRLYLTNSLNTFRGYIDHSTNATYASNLVNGAFIGTIAGVAANSTSTLIQGNGVESVKWDDAAGPGGIGGLAFTGDTFFNNSSNHFNGDVETDLNFWGNLVGNATYSTNSQKAVYVANISTNQISANQITNGGITGSFTVYTNTFLITNGLVKAVN